MKKLITCIVAGFAFTANAEESNFRNYYPTPQEVADDCEAAIKMAEEKDYKAFMRTACVARIHGIAIGSILSVPINPSDDEEKQKKLVERYGKRFCFPDFHSDNPPIVELRIARDYVNFIHDYKGDIPAEIYLNKPSAVNIADMLQENCRTKR